MPGAAVCGEGFPSKSGNAAQTKGYLQPVSLNLFTGRPLLCATVASSEKNTIFGRRVSSVRTIFPTHRSCAFMMSASMPDMLPLRRDAHVHDLARATEVKLSREEITIALYTCSSVHTVMTRFAHTRVHNLPMEVPAIASLFDTSLSLN